MKALMTAGLITLIAVAAAQPPVSNMKTSPEQINVYKSKAAWAAEHVIKQADNLKAFKESTSYRDIWTSPGALAAYEAEVTSFTQTLQTVQQGLLATATEILTSSQYEIQAAKKGMKHRGDATY